MINNSKNHLKDAQEGYFHHMFTACSISFQLLIASLQAFIHSLIPGLFAKSASSKIKELYLLIEKRKE